jgi:outer membrane protein OmpA-like peptidoglycan-associated protein
MTLKNNKEANYFARKAIKIINGEQLLPENPLYWKSDKSLLEELIFMQRRIENITSTPYLKFNLPIQLAHLFYSYDCWVSKESRPIYKNIGNSQCRENFLRLINELEIYFNDNKKDKTQAIKLINPEFNRFFVQFDPEIAILNDAGIKNMLQIIDHLLQMSSYKIMLVGNADNSAINLKNQALMLARISIIKKYLISNGVPEYVISEHNQSEDFPDLLTINNDPVKQNRGVAIYVLKGDVNLNLYPIPLLQNLFYKQQINQLYNEL